MIRLTSLPRYARAHVVGTGPSAEGVEARPGDLVVAVNRAAYALEGRGLDLIHIAADRFWVAQDAPVAKGALGVWVRLGEEPFPRRSSWPCWVPCSTGESHWEHRWGWKGPRGLEIHSVMVGGTTSCAAWNLVDEIAEEVHLWGLDGGGEYEKFRPSFDYAAATCSSRFMDHAGRLG